MMLGVIYTLKVIDIILGLTQGGPANATQTIATQSVPALVRRSSSSARAPP
jgi:ABC-type sugar transport system permease subunit